MAGNKKLTLEEFCRAGGRARWKNVSKKERSEAMKKVRAGYPHQDSGGIDTSKHVG